MSRTASRTPDRKTSGRGLSPGCVPGYTLLVWARAPRSGRRVTGRRADLDVTSVEQVRDGEGAPRSWRGGRLLPAAVFVVLALPAVVVFFVVRSNVDNQNRRLLRERTGEVALLLQSA